MTTSGMKVLSSIKVQVVVVRRNFLGSLQKEYNFRVRLLTVNIGENLNLSGSLATSGFLDVGGNLNVDGSVANATGNFTISDNLDVTGATAINVRQLYSGLAAVLAATPELRLEPGKTGAGIGLGSYGGFHAVGLGFGHMYNNGAVLTVSVGKSAQSKAAYKAGLSWTW